MLTRFTIVLILSMFFTPLEAQESASPAVDKEVAVLSGFYQLSPEQAIEVQTILRREVRNVNEIAVLRESDPYEYLERMVQIRQSTSAATRRLLNEDQRRLFKVARQQERAAWAEQYKTLQAEGLNPTQIELRLVDQYLTEKGY